MQFPDTMPLDDPMGPEFSVRIMGVCARNGIKTVGDLREKLDELPKWRGLGQKSINEIKDFFQAQSESLFHTPEYRRYRLEDAIGGTEALLQDVQRALTRAALKGHVSADTRMDMSLKLRDAAERVLKLPTHID